MKVLFLGTAGFHPSETRQTTCVMLPELGIVFDAGTGFYRVRNHLTTNCLNILLSHAHLDHSLGLTYLLDVLYQKLPEDQVKIFGLSLHLKNIRSHLFTPAIFPVQTRAKFMQIERSGQNFEIQGVKVNYLRNPEHPGVSIGYRLAMPGEKTLVFMTDLVAHDYEERIEMAKGADLLIHECNFTDQYKNLAMRTGHSWTSAVASFAIKAGVKRLALMHFNPLDPREDPTDQKSAEIKFPDTIITCDQMELEL